MSTAFGFAYPGALAALALLPLWAFFRLRERRGDAVPYAPLQTRRPGRASTGTLLLGLELLLLTLVLFGVAGPYRVTRLELFEDPGIDVVLVVDVSLSMLATDVEPNRLEASRRVARDFVERSGGHRVGIVIFGRDAFVQSPLTTARPVLFQLLESVGVHNINQEKSGGTAIGDALLVAAERLERARVEGRDQAVILITDGASNLGVDPILAARYLRHEDVRFHAVGIGGEEPVEVFFEGERVGGDDAPYLAALDEEQLRAMAEAAGGTFQRARGGGELETIFARLSRLESAPLELETRELRRFLTAPLAAVALPLFAVCLLVASALRRPLR